MKTDSLPWMATDILVAASLLTRIPLPRLPVSAFARSSQATWAYPLAGLIVGTLGALVGYFTMSLEFPQELAAGLMLAFLIVCTGAMHEDGLADVADGFWGGFNQERRLEIMKDSQIGTYGTLALVMSLGLRWIAYAFLLSHSILSVIAVAAISRAAMPALMHRLPHVRENGLSHSVGRPDAQSATTAALIGVVLAFTFAGWSAALAVLAVTLSAVFMTLLSRKKIGGQTGDVLGATQQMAEITALLAIIASM